MFSRIFSAPVQSTAPLGFGHIFKDSEASTKAWLKRQRAEQHATRMKSKYEYAMKHPRAVPTAGDFKGWIPIVHSGDSGKGWVREDGKKLTAEQLANLEKSGTPPAWDKVLLNPHPTGGNRLTNGRDANGKSQSRYREEDTAKAADEKWARVNLFHKTAMKPITAAAKRDMQDETNPQELRDLGAVIHLVARTGFRIGSDTDTGAKEQAYGASTLQKKHVKLKANGKMSFEFIGKKGVPITKELQDKPLHDFLTERLKSLGPDDTLFSATDKQALAYIKKAAGDDQFKTKDFRTWNGTAVALALRKKMPYPKTTEEWVSTQKYIAEVVAGHLGNTAPVALESYIAPYIFNRWDQSLKPVPKAKKEEREEVGDGANSDPFFPYDEMLGAMEEEMAETEAPAPVKKSVGFAAVFKDSAASVKAWQTREKRTPTDLDERLVDYKPDRSLEGPGTAKIRELLPDVDHVAYSKVPFLDKMHELMGVTDPMTHDLDDYIKRRDKLFADQPVKEAPYDKVVVTQERVNKARVQQLVDDPSTGGKKPVQTVRYKGKTYIMNGHHRVVAEMKSGATKVESAVLDLTDVSKGEKPLQSVAPEKKSHDGLAHIFKDSAASIKAWISRKKNYDSTGDDSKALTLAQNRTLGKQYYSARDKYGQDHENTKAAYAEWQKSKDVLTAKHGMSKADIAELSGKIKNEHVAHVQAMAAEKKSALTAYTDAVKTHGLGSQQAQHAAMVAEGMGADASDIDGALKAASTFIPASKPKPNPSISDWDGTEEGAQPAKVVSLPKAKANLMQAHLELKQATDSASKAKAQAALDKAALSAVASGMTAGQMAAMKAHATMAHKKNMAFAGTSTPSSAKKPAFTDTGVHASSGYEDASDHTTHSKASAITKAHYDSLSSAQQDAIGSWLGAGYSEMNKVVNGQPTGESQSQNEYTAKKVEMLKTALDHELGVPLKLRRNMAQKWFFKSFGLDHATKDDMWNLSEEKLNSLVGKTYKEKAPSSTTYRLNSNIGFTNTASESGSMALMIKAPKEAKGVFVDGFKKTGEDEVLLQAGTTYVIEKIVKASAKPYGKEPMYRVHVRIIGSD